MLWALIIATILLGLAFIGLTLIPSSSERNRRAVQISRNNHVKVTVSTGVVANASGKKNDDSTFASDGNPAGAGVGNKIAAIGTAQSLDVLIPGYSAKNRGVGIANIGAVPETGSGRLN